MTRSISFMYSDINSIALTDSEIKRYYPDQHTIFITDLEQDAIANAAAYATDAKIFRQDCEFVLLSLVIAR